MEDVFLNLRNWFLTNEGLLSSMAAMIAVASGFIFWFSTLFKTFRKSVDHLSGEGLSKKNQSTSASSLVQKASEKIFYDRYTIAVLPFRTLTASGDEDYLATGIAEDIITSLSYSRLFPVISSATSFQYGKRSADLFEIRRDLNAKYVVTGTIGHGQNGLKLSVELADCESQKQLWSERFTSAATNIFNLQEQVSEIIIGKLSPAIRSAGMSYARRVPPNNSDAWDHVLRGLWFNSQNTKESNLQAIKEFTIAITIDSEFGYTYALLAYVYHLRGYMGWSETFSDDIKLADENALRAISLDSEVAEAYLVLSLNALFMGKFEVAETMASTAIELNPCNGLCWLAIGLVSLYRDRHEVAIEHFLHVKRLNPRDPLQWLFQIASSLAYFFHDDFESSLSYAQLAAIQPQGKIAGELLQVACLSALERHDEANLFMKTSPPNKRAWQFVLSRLPFENPDRRQEIINMSLSLI
jgi:TolB-like protein